MNNNKAFGFSSKRRGYRIGKEYRILHSSRRSIGTGLFCIVIFVFFLTINYDVSYSRGGTATTYSSLRSFKKDNDRKILEIHNDGEHAEDNHEQKPMLDFIIAGFPKCGTTSLLQLFASQQGTTSMIPREACQINSKRHREFESVSNELTQLRMEHESTLIGIKCPDSVWDLEGISRLRNHNKDIKLIIGVRHPILFFQSYYNYRVTEMHNKNEVIVPPPADTLVGLNIWRGISTEFTRFELGLMQLGKVDVHARDLVAIGKLLRRGRVISTPFKIFLYDLEQMEDMNTERAKLFRSDLRDFLGLKKDFKEIPRGNVNFDVGQSGYPETIDICHSQYNGIRSILRENGKRTRNWIRDQFISSQDVTVGGKEHFLEIIESWAGDPCKKKIIKNP